MSDKNNTSRGVIVEFDFAVIDGAQVLFDVAKAVLSKHGIKLDVKQEALYLAGGNYQGALKDLFSAKNVDADETAVAGELADAFKAALADKAAAAITPGFKAFIDGLVNRGFRVIVATRIDEEQVKPLFEGYDEELVTVYSDASKTYGNFKWDAWRRACSQNHLIDVLTAAVTGSGNGVKSALVAGLSALAVMHDHVAYQDFGGADVVIEGELNAKAADAVARMLHAQ